MTARPSRFPLSPLQSGTAWTALSLSQQQLWKDFANGNPQAWLDFRDIIRDGKVVFTNIAAAMSAEAGSATSPDELPTPQEVERGIFEAASLILTDAPSFHWEVTRTPALDLDFLVFATAPADTAAEVDAGYCPFIDTDSIGMGAAPDDPTKEMWSEYADVFGSLTTHTGKFILIFVFVFVRGGLHFYFSQMAEVST